MNHSLLRVLTLASMITVCLALIARAACAQEMPAEYQNVLKLLDRQGDFKANVLKINVPRKDLTIVVDGVATPTPFGFGGWLGMTKGDGGMEVMMGDLVLTEDEVNPVMSALLDNGLEVTALHNHFFYETPRIFYMHVMGHGSAADLARRAKPALDLIGHVPARHPSSAAPTAIVQPGTIDTAKIAQIVGHEGEQLGAVYKITVGRDDIQLKEMGATINARMGLNTWATFVGTDEHAAVAGDVAMLESEVTPVLKTLRSHGLEVVAIHHHMIGTKPTIIFLHYWGQGPADKLAAGFKAALKELGGNNRGGRATHAESSSAEATDIVNAIKVTAQKDCGCGHCAAKGCDPCHGKNCHYCVAKALVVNDCGCGGCDAKGCPMCGPGCDVCKFHLAPNATAAPAGSEPTKQP